MIFEHQEGRKNNEKSKNKGKYNRFSLEFSKLCLIVEVNIILCDMVFGVCTVLIIMLFICN